MKFYATIQGNRLAKTCGGTINSGIRSSVQSWHGSCITGLCEQDGKLVLTIDTADDSRANMGNRKYYGTIEEFNDLMDLVNKVGKTKAIELLKEAK